MKILIAGSSGFVGKALARHLVSQGHQVYTLVRSKEEADGQNRFYWNPETGEIDPSVFEEMDAVINLSGENIAGYWTKSKKEEILKSRVQATRTIASAIAKANNPPKVLLNASATGYYGNGGTQELTEASLKGAGFLSDVCQKWEEAAAKAEEKGIRVVFLRFGVVLCRNEGALKKMLIPFKLGLGGRLGNGKQYMSWVSIDDLVAAVQFILKHDDIKGPVNIVAPQSVTNEEFTEKLGKVLERPTIIPMPAFMLRILTGEMADEMLLVSERVKPEVLQKNGFNFAYPDLEQALKHLLKH